MVVMTMIMEKTMEAEKVHMIEMLGLHLIVYVGRACCWQDLYSCRCYVPVYCYLRYHAFHFHELSSAFKSDQST